MDTDNGIGYEVKRLDNMLNTLADDEIALAIIYLLEGKSVKVLDIVQGSLSDFRRDRLYLEKLSMLEGLRQEWLADPKARVTIHNVIDSSGSHIAKIKRLTAELGCTLEQASHLLAEVQSERSE